MARLPSTTNHTAGLTSVLPAVISMTATDQVPTTATTATRRGKK
jgi:hypothetical protein